MRPAAVLSYAVAAFLGQATLDLVSAIVAEREGGMGLGSALIVVGVVHLAAVAGGAILGGDVADRLGPQRVAVAASLGLYAGLLGVAAAPMGALGWLTATAVVTGIGFGALLSAAFTAAAVVDPGRRVVGVVALLVALLVARAAATLALPIASEVGVTAIPVVGAAIVGLALAAALLDRGAPPPSRNGGWAVGVGRATLIGVAVGLGTLAALAGTDPSRLSAALLAGLVGAGALEALDVARLALLAGGIGLIAAGGLALHGAAPAVGDVTRVAVPALGLAALAAAGVGSAVTLALARAAPDGAPVEPGVVTLAGGLAGLLLGGLWLARGAAGHPAAAGSALLVLAAGAAVAGLGVVEAPSALLVAFVAAAGIGWGMVASALRVLLARPTNSRGLAAGGGVAASAIGAALGGMIGSSLALDLLRGTQAGWSVPGAVIVLAAVVAAGIVVVGVPRSGSAWRAGSA